MLHVGLASETPHDGIPTANLNGNPVDVLVLVELLLTGNQLRKRLGNDEVLLVIDFIRFLHTLFKLPP